MEGDDLSDPIADTVRSIFDGHIVLSRKLASQNHYPAIDLLNSISRIMIDVVSKEHKELANKFIDILATYQDAEDLINIGAYVMGSNPKIDYVIKMRDKVNSYLKQGINDKVDFEQSLAELPADEQEKPEVQTLRAQLFFSRIAAAGDPPAETAQRLEQVPDDTEARYRLAAQQVMANDVENAVDNLLLIVQKDRKFGDDAGRVALLRLFDMLGEDPAVNRYRARMFNLLH